MAGWKMEFDMSFNSESKRPGTAGSSRKTMVEAARQEIRAKVLRALQKLSDRDTQQSALEELLRTAKELKPELTTVVVNQLVEYEEVKSAFARGQSARLFAVIVETQYQATQSHLVRIVSTLARRMRDLDSSVRDSCAETLGELTRLVCSQESVSASKSDDGVDFEASVLSASMLTDDKSPTLEIFFRPLFQGMSSADSNQQQGCALAIAHVFFKAGKKLEPYLETLTKKITSVLDSPQFSGKPQLLTAIANVVEVYPEGISPLIRHFIPRVVNAGMSQDWNTRKHAMETIETMAAKLDSAILQIFKQDITSAVDKNRYDKVKPVRDAAIQAGQTLAQNSVFARDEDTFSERPSTARNDIEPKHNNPPELEDALDAPPLSARRAEPAFTPTRVPFSSAASAANSRASCKREIMCDSKAPLTASALEMPPPPAPAALPPPAAAARDADSLPSRETWDRLLAHFDCLTRQQTQLIEMVSSFSESARERLETVEQKVFALELRQATIEQRQSLPGMPPTPSRAVLGASSAVTPGPHARLRPLAEAAAEAEVAAGGADPDFRM